MIPGDKVMLVEPLPKRNAPRPALRFGVVYCVESARKKYVPSAKRTYTSIKLVGVTDAKRIEGDPPETISACHFMTVEAIQKARRVLGGHPPTSS
jgi:hypothetical protein